MKCLNCQRWDLRAGDPKMAKLGFAVCSVKSLHKGHTTSALFDRECDSHVPVADEVAAKRAAWIGVAWTT